MARKRIPPTLNILNGNPSKRPLKVPLDSSRTARLQHAFQNIKMLKEVPEPPEVLQNMPDCVEIWNRVAADLVARQLL